MKKENLDNGIKPDVIGLAVKGAAVREIKFRAWHIEEKILCQVETLTNQGAFLLGVKKGKDQISDRMITYAPDDGRFCKNAEIELMQYTGLKDMNGKDIYEGDILRHPAKDDWEKKNYACFEVFWHDNDSADRHIGFQLNRVHLHGALSGYGGAESMLPKWTKQLEIIGNIHENGLGAAAPLTACR